MQSRWSSHHQIVLTFAAASADAAGSLNLWALCKSDLGGLTHVIGNPVANIRMGSDYELVSEFLMRTQAVLTDEKIFFAYVIQNVAYALDRSKVWMAGAWLSKSNIAYS